MTIDLMIRAPERQIDARAPTRALDPKKQPWPLRVLLGRKILPLGDFTRSCFASWRKRRSGSLDLIASTLVGTIASIAGASGPP